MKRYDIFKSEDENVTGAIAVIDSSSDSPLEERTVTIKFGEQEKQEVTFSTSKSNLEELLSDAYGLESSDDFKNYIDNLAINSDQLIFKDKENSNEVAATFGNETFYSYELSLAYSQQPNSASLLSSSFTNIAITEDNAQKQISNFIIKKVGGNSISYKFALEDLEQEGMQRLALFEQKNVVNGQRYYPAIKFYSFDYLQKHQNLKQDIEQFQVQNEQQWLALMIFLGLLNNATFKSINLSAGDSLEVYSSGSKPNEGNRVEINQILGEERKGFIAVLYSTEQGKEEKVPTAIINKLQLAALSKGMTFEEFNVESKKLVEFARYLKPTLAGVGISSTAGAGVMFLLWGVKASLLGTVSMGALGTLPLSGVLGVGLAATAVICFFLWNVVRDLEEKKAESFYNKFCTITDSGVFGKTELKKDEENDDTQDPPNNGY